MNQKKAKKLRQLLKGALGSKEVETVTAPGIVKPAAVKTTKVSYVETERNRKIQTVALTPVELEQAFAWAMEQDRILQELHPAASTTGAVSSPTPTKVPTTKQILLAPGTMMVSTGTYRGTYLALKKGLGKKKL